MLGEISPIFLLHLPPIRKEKCVRGDGKLETKKRDQRFRCSWERKCRSMREYLVECRWVVERSKSSRFLGFLVYFFLSSVCVFVHSRVWYIGIHSSFIYFLLFHVEDFWLNMALLILFLWNLFEWIRNKRKSDRFCSIIYWFFNVIMLYLILLLEKKVACFFLLKKLHWASCSRRESNTLWY